MHPSAWFRGCLAAIVAGVTLTFAAPALAESVTIPAAGSLPAIPGNLQRPAGPGPFPAVLVLAGCDGISSLENKTAAELVKQGYVALVLDVLAPQGLKNACTAGAPTIATSARFAYVSLGWLAAQPGVIPDHLGVIGFSMGAIEILGLVDPLTPHVPPPGLRRAAVRVLPRLRSNAGRTLALRQIRRVLPRPHADDWTLRHEGTLRKFSTQAAFWTQPGKDRARRLPQPGNRSDHDVSRRHARVQPPGWPTHLSWPHPAIRR